MGYGFKIMVSGKYACFTRPEMKTERVSYDVPPPGAMEGLIKSIYWKPAFRIVIDKIIVFNPIKFVNIRRNEVKEKVSFSNVKKQMKDGEPRAELYTSEIRSQRGSMVLRDVLYGVEFHFELTGIRSEHDDESEEKHYNIMLRRLKRGQFFRPPVLGCREFAADKVELVDEFPTDRISEELKGDFDLGYMLYHMQFRDGGIPKDNDWDARKFSDEADAMFYRPHMIDGVIDVAKYKEMMKC